MVEAVCVRNYLLALLARRDYATSELVSKLQQKFGAAENWQAVLLELQKSGLQSDRRFAENFVRSHPKWGALKLQYTLQNLGVAEDLIHEFLPSKEMEIMKLRQNLELKLSQQKLVLNLRERKKLIGFLRQRGFALALIQKVLND